jgi:hypothetical protein
MSSKAEGKMTNISNLLKACSPEMRIMTAVGQAVRDGKTEGEQIELIARLLMEYTACANTLEDVFAAAWRNGYAISHREAKKVLDITSDRSVIDPDGIEDIVKEWWETARHQPAHDWIGCFYVPGAGEAMFCSLQRAWDRAREINGEIYILPLDDEAAVLPDIDEVDLDDCTRLDVDSSPYFLAGCTVCGWIGSSESVHGGTALGDTGDRTPLVCPDCGAVDCIEDADLNT